MKSSTSAGVLNARAFSTSVRVVDRSYPSSTASELLVPLPESREWATMKARRKFQFPAYRHPGISFSLELRTRYEGGGKQFVAANTFCAASELKPSRDR